MKKNKRNGLILFFLSWILFTLIYTYRLTRFPIFEDEAIHLLMAERLFNNLWSNFFLYMQHYFLPGFGWLMLPIRFFVKDSLLAGRLLNVLLASSLFFWLYLVGKRFKLPIRFFVLSSVLLLFSPILFLNSRLALLDTSVMVLSAWSLYFLILILKNPKPFNLFLFFFVLLTLLLTKFTSFLIFPSLIYLFLLDYRKTGKLSKYKYHALIFFLVLVSFFLIIRPYLFRVSDVLKTGLVFSLGIGDILARVRQNFWLFLNWSKIYYPLLPLSAVCFITLLLGRQKFKGRELMTALLIWFITSLTIMVCFNRFYYPRHILMLLIPLQVIPVFVLLKYPLKTSVFFTLLGVFVSIALFADLVFDTTFTKAEMANEDRFQYFEDYTSGININDIAVFLSGRAVENPNEKVTVWLDGSWVMEYGLRRALKSVSNIEFRSFVDFESQRFAILGKVIKDNKLTYVVVNRYRPVNMRDLSLEKEFSWGGYHPEYVYVIR